MNKSQWVAGDRIVIKHDTNFARVGTVRNIELKGNTAYLDIILDNNQIKKIPIGDSSILGVGNNKKNRQLIPMDEVNDYYLFQKQFIPPARNEIYVTVLKAKESKNINHMIRQRLGFSKKGN